MSSTSERGPGRPPGMTEARLAKQAKVRRMADIGISVAQIAAIEEIDPAYVRILIGGGAKEDGQPDAAAEREPPQPCRLSPRAAHSRASEYAEEFVISDLGLAANAFWVRLVVAIHEEGDGYRLGIGEAGSRFRSRAGLKYLFGGQELRIDDWIALLVEYGRLKETGIDIGIPHGMGLTPAENLRRRPAPKRAAPGGGRRQGEMLHAVPGPPDATEIAPDATEIPPRTQLKPELNLRSEEFNLRPGATEIPGDANLIQGKFPPAGVAHAAAAAADAKESTPLAAAAACDSRAGDATETAPGATEIPPAGGPGATEINSQRPDGALAGLVAELAELAGLGRPPAPKDVGAVQGWARKGASADTVRAVIGAVRSRPNGARPTSLAYFDKAVDEAVQAAARPPARAAPPAPPAAGPPPPSDAAVAERVAAAEAWIPAPLAAQWARVRSRLKAEVGDGLYRSMLREMALTAADGEELTVSLPTDFARDYVAKAYGDRLRALWRIEDPAIGRIEVGTAPALRPSG